MKIFAALILILLFITGCNSDTPPNDPDPVVPMRHETGHTTGGMPSVSFDFYIQATSYIAGFARAVEQAQAGVDTPFADILHLLSYAADRLDGGRGYRRSYYRFDVINYDGCNNTFYRLDGGRNQFEQEAAANPFFFSIPWYFVQDARHPNRFEELILPPFENHYRTNFLSNTINRINQDHLSIIVTDLVEHGFNTDTIVSSLSNVIDNQDKAIFLFAFRLPFLGNAYNNTYPPEADMAGGSNEWQPLWHDGTRPLYVLVIGDASKVFMYSELLIAALTQRSLNFNYTFFHRSNAVATVYNFHENSTILRDTTAIIYRNPGPQVRWHNGSRLRSYDDRPLAEEAILYLDVHSAFRQTYARLDITIPFTLPAFWAANDTSLYLTHEIEYLHNTQEGWHPITNDQAQRIMGNSSVSWDGGNELQLAININVGRHGAGQSLRTLGNYRINRFRITTYVRIMRNSLMPDWADNYASFENIPNRIQDDNIFGSYTVGLSHILTQLSLRAGNFSEDEDTSGVAANILVYAIVDQRTN